MNGKFAAIIAMELYQEPRLVERLRKLPLHHDVLSLIKIAAGDEVALSVFPPLLRKDAERTRSIAIFYLQQVLFHPKSSDIRLLGLNEGATPQAIKDHKRWLLKWLHPDRNQNKWEQVYFKRVTDAAERLLSSEMQLQPNLVASKRRRSRGMVLTARYSDNTVRKILPLWPRVKRRLLSFSLFALVFGVTTTSIMSMMGYNNTPSFYAKLASIMGY